MKRKEVTSGFQKTTTIIIHTLIKLAKDQYKAQASRIENAGGN